MEVILEKSLKRTLGMKKDKIPGDPYEVIPIPDRKTAKNTIELYLSRKGIQILKSCEHFINLEVLWINDNKLKSIHGLDKNFRLKELYAHNNWIKTLEGSLAHLNHLRTVTLYNNELSDLDHTLNHFKNLHYLQHLELYDNPLSEEQHYRKKVVAFLPRLQIFDRHSRF